MLMSPLYTSSIILCKSEPYHESTRFSIHRLESTNGALLMITIPLPPTQEADRTHPKSFHDIIVSTKNSFVGIHLHSHFSFCVYMLKQKLLATKLRKGNIAYRAVTKFN